MNQIQNNMQDAFRHGKLTALINCCKNMQKDKFTNKPWTFQLICDFPYRNLFTVTNGRLLILLIEKCPVYCFEFVVISTKFYYFNCDLSLFFQSYFNLFKLSFYEESNVWYTVFVNKSSQHGVLLVTSEY